jgi:hypothetical protein
MRIPDISASKSTVTRLFVAGAVTSLAGLALGTVATVAAITGGAVRLGGPELVAVEPSALAGAVAWLALAGILATAGSVAAVASWLGALANTLRLDDKTWFVSLLGLGLVSFGVVAMIAYLVAGPDSTRRQPA